MTKHKNSEQPNENEPIPEVNDSAMVSISETELTQLKQDALEYKDKYLRQLAEADNMRKRMQKERQELIQYAVQNVLVDILHPIDHFENALKFTQQASDEVKHWALGFQMLLNQFKDVLANNGVVAFTSQGTPFDPHCHEAIEMVTSTEFAPGIVMEESIRGYKMGDKVIRPARVKVAKAPDETSLDQQQKC
ncbi:MAG: nucleotide exchange factor GrpE [Parachlamydiaceae bacterium]|nr:nucleotide exchange factor GrpE [Parachlamydiaceae bacterium]